MRDLIFYSLEPWDEIWRRNQFLVDLLVRRNPTLRVLFVAPASNLGKRRTRLAGVPGIGGPPRSLESHGRVFLAQPVKLPFDTRPAVRAANDLLQSAALRRWTRQLGFRAPTLWLNDHHRVHLAHGWRGPVIYDVTDDWIAAAADPRDRATIARHDAALCARADATIVCSARLAELKRPLVASPARLHVVPNGVHVAHYAGVSDRGQPVPAATAAWERPVYGYTGTVHAERVDVPLVEATARRLTRGSMVFVGPNLLDEPTRRRLEATGRVRFVPPVPYAQIPQFMRAMDVMMVPHRTSDFVESLNPIKLWEYLAAGLPIVATPVAGFRDFPSLVSLADGDAAFADALVAATSELAGLAAERVRVAGAHAWERRVGQVEQILDACERAADPSPMATPVEPVGALQNQS